MELHRTEIGDLDAVATLLRSAFSAPPDAPFVKRDLLQWKYLIPGPQWDGSRSYTLRKAGQIHAHCAAWPMNLSFLGGQVTCLCYIDWANRGDVPGAGFMLKKKLMKLSQTSLVVGGSKETREIVPKLGFDHVGEVQLLARVLRPWKQYRSRPREPLLMRAARLARNTSWSLFVDNSPVKDWHVRRVDSFDQTRDFNRISQFPTPWRDANYLNYWIGCPAASVSAFELFTTGVFVGYFLLSRVGGQTRIADLRVNSEDPTNWTTGYALAAATAAEDLETCEIVAPASTPLVLDSLKALGFRSRGSSPIFLYDPKKLLTKHPPIFWNMIEGDAAYLSDPASPYVT